MKASQKIQEALKSIMSDGEANAAQVYKAYDYDGVIQAHGWFYRPFGELAHYLGRNLQEALETIEAIAAERAEAR